MKRQLLSITLLLLTCLPGLMLSGCTIKKMDPQYRQALTLDKESSAFVNRVMPQIIDHWDLDILLAHAHPKLLESTSEAKIRSLFTRFSQKLGPLKEYEGATGYAKTRNYPKYGPVTTASYTVKGMFEKGDGEIILKLIKPADQWQILFFQVNSEALTVP